MKSLIEKALQDHEELRQQWSENSFPCAIDFADELDSVNGLPVRVLCLSDFHMNLRDTHSDATVLKGENAYEIYVCPERIQFDCDLHGIDEPYATRFIILHEYGHILHGDVFEDNPVEIAERDPSCVAESERKANGYAALRTSSEMERAKNHQARELFKRIEEKKWIADPHELPPDLFQHIPKMDKS